MPNNTTLESCDIEEICQELGVDPADADPRRACPICERQRRESRWEARKAVCEVRPAGDKEYSIRLECSNDLCLFTTLLRVGVDAPKEDSE